MPHLRFDIAADGTTSWVKVAGEVDVQTAPELLDAVCVVHECNHQDVTLDLAAVTFMDSRGLATLVMAHRHLAGKGCRLRIVNARRGVATLLRMTGVTDYLADPDGLPA